MSAGLTQRLARLLAAIRELTVEGVPPTIDQLRVRLGLASKAQVHAGLTKLRERGQVDWIPQRRQSLTIVERREISRADLERLSDEELRRIASWAYAILSQRPGFDPCLSGSHP